jgi:hypothetical protein
LLGKGWGEKGWGERAHDRADDWCWAAVVWPT